MLEWIDDLVSSRGSRVFVERVPEGQNGLVLRELIRRVGRVVHVVEDEVYARRLYETFRFFAPEIEATIFPAWDCLAYDRISPHRKAMSRRMALLQRLKQGAIPEHFLVITTVNAILQRIPPPWALSSWRVYPKARVCLDELSEYLQAYGYLRTGTVHEPGEYAIRGGLIDLFPPTESHPFRLELLGNTIQTMRVFDELTQRTFKSCQEVLLIPASEFLFDAESIERFSRQYEGLQEGGIPPEDPLYEAVKARRRYPGMEHWLPLLYSSMATLFEYCPGSWLSLESTRIEQRIEERFKTIENFYQTRLAEPSLPVPLPPDRLYPRDWDRGRACTVVIFTPFRSAARNGRIYDGGGLYHNFTLSASHGTRFDRLKPLIEQCQQKGQRVILACYSQGSRDRLHTLLLEHGFLTVIKSTSWQEIGSYQLESVFLALLTLETGFENDLCIVLTEHDLFGRHLGRAEPSPRTAASRLLTELSDWTEGDFLIHRNYGIGLYQGLKLIQGHEYFCLMYQDQAKLYVPVEEANLLSHYSLQEETPTLDRLGSGQWQKRKSRVKKRLQGIAQELITHRASRSLQTTPPFYIPQDIYETFRSRFPYIETEDQQTVIDKVSESLAQETPMDLLVCGDAGFGKTEVALRAALIVGLSGYQVMVIVPTTLLARQHYQRFTERFADFPIVIGQLSSLFRTPNIQTDLSQGVIDIVIGTQALLGKGIRFKRLGLVIIDEEQRFGVKQKETLKVLSAAIHVLTLSATPIPRTLQMALAGIRDMSVIATPPVDRLMVHTFVLAYDPMVIREALLREFQRGGQCFYVCPQIEHLPQAHALLKTLVPELAVVEVHGQMPRGNLEQRMIAFDRGQYDILLSTNIIESGLDLPRVNTLIVHHADLFGLSQLYQLRGRVGRSKLQGYAYFTYHKGLSPRAEKRLNVIQKLDSLGVGFHVAMRDMDLRGGGNLLGTEQSGHIREVGVELFQIMLQEEVRRLSESPARDDDEWIPQIHLGLSLWIPSEYIPEVHIRLNLYRRMTELTDQTMIDAFGIELIDRFGPLPQEVDNLLQVIRLKQLCRIVGVKKIEVTSKSFIVTFVENVTDPDHILDYLQQNPGCLRLSSDYRLFYTPKEGTKIKRFSKIYRLLEALIPPSDQARCCR